jgi:hypothetical protein
MQALDRPSPERDEGDHPLRRKRQPDRFGAVGQLEAMKKLDAQSAGRLVFAVLMQNQLRLSSPARYETAPGIYRLPPPIGQ